jgi:hypothetical protein
MSQPAPDRYSSRDTQATSPADASAPSGGDPNPLWLLVGAGALFFAFAAAFLAAG